MSSIVQIFTHNLFAFGQFQFSFKSSQKDIIWFLQFIVAGLASLKNKSHKVFSCCQVNSFYGALIKEMDMTIGDELIFPEMFSFENFQKQTYRNLTILLY